MLIIFKNPKLHSKLKKKVKENKTNIIFKHLAMLRDMLEGKVPDLAMLRDMLEGRAAVGDGQLGICMLLSSQ